MRRIRSSLAAAGPLTKWIHEVQGSNGKMNYAQWYAPCPWSPPDHIWYPHTGGGNTRAGSNFEQSASLVTITDHNKLNHNNGQGHNEPRVPGEHMCCSFTVAEVDAEVLERNRRIARVAGRLANGIRWIWQRQSAAIHCDSSTFPVFHVKFVIFVGVACNAYRCWAQLFQWIDLSFEDSGRIDWTKINVAKSKFSMLKSIEMRHPKHQSCKVQLHPAEEQDVEITFTLEENEEFVGFQFFEAKQGAQKTNIVKMNSSLFKEVFNKSARVGAMEKRDLPVRSRIRKPEPASGTIHTFWSALWRRRMWNHCRDIFSIPLRSLGDVVGSLPRQSLPLTAQSKETRHRLKLVWKDSVVFESRRFECLLKFIKKSIFPKESLRMKGKPNWSSWRSWPSKSLTT